MSNSSTDMRFTDEHQSQDETHVTEELVAEFGAELQALADSDARSAPLAKAVLDVHEEVSES